MADLESGVAALEEEVGELRSARGSPSGNAQPSSTSSQPTRNACDDLGGFYELGSEGCAKLIADMEACEAELSNDPDWIQDGALYEHRVTGEITTCDI